MNDLLPGGSTGATVDESINTSVDADPSASASAQERLRLRRGADLESLPRGAGPPPVTGVIRRHPEDFIVEEQLAFPLTGAGEHLYLRIRKTGQNTRWVAKQLARTLSLSFKAVGFAGLKDRHAITDQWFSLHLPGQADPELAALGIEGVEVREAVRHSSKLRTGALSGNRFRIVVRDIEGDLDALEARLGRLHDTPVPNYFGAQRFGRDAGNLDLLFAAGSDGSPGRGIGREARSFGLSAHRSALFNLWLAGRIDDGTWRTPLDGEIVYLEDEHRYRHVDKLDAAQPCVPTGLLWGPGDNQATGTALAREQAFRTNFATTYQLLCEYDVRMMRRPLWLRPADFDYELDRAVGASLLKLQFGLTRGQFATAVIREFCRHTG